MGTRHVQAEFLIEGVAAIASILIARDDETAATGRARWASVYQALEDPKNDSRLAGLVQRFHLSDFEAKCIFLALAVHIEPRMPAVAAESGSELSSRSVTVRLALEHFCSDAATRITARRAFLPSSSLVRHRLIDLGRSEVGAEGLLSRRISLTTPTLRYILEEDELSDAVATVARLQHPNISLFNVILDETHLSQVRELVEQHARYREIIMEWGFERILPYGKGLAMLFSGASGTGKTLTAEVLAAHVKRPLLVLSAADIPERDGVDTLLRDLIAEATMRDAIVLLDECETLLGKGDRRKATTFKAIEDFEGILIMTTNHPEMLDEAVERRIIYHFPFDIPDADQRRAIWEVHLPPEVPLDGEIDLGILANRYDFTGGTIKNAMLVAVNRALTRSKVSPKITMADLNEGCLSQLRYALEELTVRSTTHLRLKDIVLPEEETRKVNEIIAAIRNQAVVLNRWGFGKKLVTGKGITCLFDGPPGTGKTLCAEIVAGEFDRPLYRVNIPEVVSKWVGETEKHIKEIFQQARISHAMLLFDEADSLFGSRSGDASSATERYANMEVNLLLQEIERFPGVCILTTNFFGALDKALIRRIQYRVTFEEPNATQRTKIWEVMCPPETPLADDVDFGEIGEDYELTGGLIKNSLLRAAYWACEAETKITQSILHDACRDEYKAAGKLARDYSYEPPDTEELFHGSGAELRQLKSDAGEET